MTSRERFGLWLSDFTNKHGHPPEIDDAWQAAERQALERAREAVDAEHLEGETDNPSDFAYQCAVDDCVNAIGALIEQSASKEKQG